MENESPASKTDESISNCSQEQVSRCSFENLALASDERNPGSSSGITMRGMELELDGLEWVVGGRRQGPWKVMGLAEFCLEMKENSRYKVVYHP